MGRTDSLASHKRQLANTANRTLMAPIRASLIINSNNDDDVIKSALDFLKSVAQSERAKEIRVIKRYINEIKQNQMLTNILKSQSKQRDDLTHLIQDLEDFSANPTDGADLTNFYSKLTLLINTIRNSFESFNERLDQLLDKNRAISEEGVKHGASTHKIRSDFFATRVSGDIDTLMRNLTGTVQRETETALSTRIVKLLTDFVATNLKVNTTVLEYPIEALIALMIDFEKYLQTHYDQLGLNNILHLEDLDIESIFTNYTATSNTFLDRLKQNNQDIITTLQTIRTEMGIRELTAQEDECKERQRVLDKLTNSKKTTNPKTRQRINSILKAGGKTAISNYVRWNVTTSRNNRHGAVYELILPVLEGGLKVGGHAATDVITLDLGTIHLSVDAEAAIRSQVNSIRSVIEEEAKLQRTDRQDDLINAAKAMNTNIQTSITTINKILQENRVPEDIFIYHQSLKLYTQIEEHKVAQFHGREMQILNMLDNLYTLDQDVALVDQSILYGAILNLSELAIGHSTKSLIENSLSIFAGLLMFDDVQTMAWDVARTAAAQAETGEAYNIHLYLVNDIYVPGSLVLTTIAQALSQGYTHISAQNGAKVTIDTGGATDAIQGWLDRRASGTPYAANTGWAEMAEQVAKGTKAQITFLSAFFSFLTDIQNYIV